MIAAVIVAAVVNGNAPLDVIDIGYATSPWVGRCSRMLLDVCQRSIESLTHSPQSVPHMAEGASRCPGRIKTVPNRTDRSVIAAVIVAALVNGNAPLDVIDIGYATSPSVGRCS